MTDDMSGRGPLLAVQSVLTHASALAVRRMLVTIDKAVGVARDTRPSWVVLVRLADCSELPTFAPEELDAIARELDNVKLHYFRLDPATDLESAHKAIAQDSDDFLLVIESGALLSSDSVRLLLDIMDDSFVGVVDGKTLPLEEAKPFDSISGETPWCSSAFSLLRCQAFREEGPLTDTAVFGPKGEVALSDRLRGRGWKALHHPGSVVFLDRRLESVGVLADVTPDSGEGYRGGR